MSDDVKPMDDEQVGMYEERVARGYGHWSNDVLAAALARIAVEKARAEKAEADNRRWEEARITSIRQNSEATEAELTNLRATVERVRKGISAIREAAHMGPWTELTTDQRALSVAMLAAVLKIEAALEPVRPADRDDNA